MFHRVKFNENFRMLWLVTGEKKSMANISRPGIVLLSCLACIATAYAEVTPPAGWDRFSAESAARSIDTSETRRQLINFTVAGSAEETLALLLRTGSRTDWPVPAREAAIYGYTQDLRALPSSAVPVKVMTFLKNYQARTLVPHDDHPRAGVPLFNVRAAAAGVENGWTRQTATLEGAALLSSNPRSLVDAFSLEPHPAARQGYLEALNTASPEQLRSVANNSSNRLKRQGELTNLAGRAALLLADTGALQEVYALGEGPGLAQLMRATARSLPATDIALLLDTTLAHGSTEAAALAIAELAPAVAMQPATQSLLLQTLGDPDLGAAAALALATHATPATIEQLREIAETPGESLGATRATLALDLNRDQFGGEVRQ